MKQVQALVLCGFGLNCDYETAYACEMAGAKADRVHINSLIDGTVDLTSYQLMVFGGGFSWGDDHGAGVIQAVRMKTAIGDKILEFIRSGNLILGICNGFQTLVNMGLLPGFDGNYTTRSVALIYNDCGNFRDDWVLLKANSESPCVFTKGLDVIELPIRHGEGKFYADPQVIDRLKANHQIVFQYAMSSSANANGKFPYNPNGSVMDIAGICDETGRVFGLMPHPEAYNHWTNHPTWTQDKEHHIRFGTSISRYPLGTQIFKNAVMYIENTVLNR